MPDRPDPVTDSLARFTPSAPGLDRDAILFAAGRRAARGSWVWKALAVTLAVSQLVTLVALWPKEPARKLLRYVTKMEAVGGFKLPPATNWVDAETFEPLLTQACRRASDSN